jgi:dolichyl-phosphate beta-glucosyltransferase
MIKISIIIPTKNEILSEETFRTLSDSCKGYDHEILIVDDSVAEIQSKLIQLVEKQPNHCVRVIHGDGKGKGGAVRKGIRDANGTVIFYMDADLRISLSYVEEFIKKIVLENFDLVIAERSFDRTLRTPLRFFLSLSLFLIVRLFVFQSRFFFDTQCGFKAFRADIIRRMASQQIIDGGMFDVEYLYMAVKNKLRVAKISVSPLLEIRSSKINLLRCAFCDFLDLIKIKLRGSSGHYILRCL